MAWGQYGIDHRLADEDAVLPGRPAAFDDEQFAGRARAVREVLGPQVIAGDGDLEGFANLVHPGICQSAKAADENCD
jgi:hypothetical protein